jgi:hypothetical protein
MVRTIAGKAKDRFHDMLAEVQAVKKSGCRVKILEGPAVDTMKDYPFKMLAPFDNTDEGMETPIEEGDEKRAEIAAKLFGTNLD